MKLLSLAAATVLSCTLLLALTAEARPVSADMANVARPMSTTWRDCVGADRGAILLRQANQDQLKLVQDEIGFRYIRFHGIFNDETDPYREISGRPYYNFDRVNAVYANALKAGIKPMVEVGFMPSDLASDSRTIFYWKGNGSPPKDWAKWSDFITAFTRNLESTFGRDEVRTWRFEVWNEPNLDGFWTNGSQPNYFKLYDTTVMAIKSVDRDLAVGGPATAGAAWVPEFLAHAQQAKVPVDFITTHSYGVEGGFLDENGVGDNKLVRDRMAITNDIVNVRKQIDASSKPNLPLYITEWSTSYSPRDPIHDTYLSAPFILNKLKATQSKAQSMSYWVYSDLFEEAGPTPSSFHGGFGLLNREGIRKPAFFAYKYLAALGPQELSNGDSESWLTRDGNNFSGLIWNFTLPDQEQSNRPYFTKAHPSIATEPVDLALASLKPGAYRLRVYRTGYRANDAYTTYMEWGRPKDLNPKQIAVLQQHTADVPELDSKIKVGANGKLSRKIELRVNDVLLVKLEFVGG
ncbi:MAG: cellulase family glycosylhydrolase [Novosphingobium sp.]